MNTQIEKRAFFRKLIPLAISQTLGVFNDNAFKALLVFIAIDIDKRYSSNSYFMFLMTVVFVMPFILLAVPSGFMPDRFDKKKILVLSKFSEVIIMFFGAILFLFIHQLGIYPLVIILFLMAAQSSFFSPALNSILPETFTELEISKANGIIIMLNFIAVILGYASGALLKNLFNNYFYCGLFFTFIGTIGFLFSLFIEKQKSKHKIRWNNNLIRAFIKNLKLAMRKKSVAISIIGEAYFYGIGSSVQIIIILFGRFTLHLRSDYELALLQLVIAIGIAIGCYLGGIFSKNKLELGLVPYGGIGIALSLIAMLYIRGNPVTLNFLGKTLLIFPYTILFLGLAGIFGGIFVVPLKVCQQERTEDYERGRILAISNFCSFVVILFYAIITYALTGKSESLGKTAGAQATMNSLMLSLSPTVVIYIFSFITLAIIVVGMILHREFLIRAIAIIFSRFLFFVREDGIENIPTKGALLLLSNNVTPIDPFIIVSGCSREIVFAIDKNKFGNSFIYNWLYRLCSFIIIPDRKSAKYNRVHKKIEQALKRGNAVLYFPEKQATKNGLLGELSYDFKYFFPKNRVIKLLPIYMGNIWGSIFSHYFKVVGKKILDFGLFYPISLSFSKPFIYSNNFTIFELRQIISELSTRSISIYMKGKEYPIHSKFIKIAKKRPFKRIFIDSDGASLSLFSSLLKAVVLSKKIRELKDDNPYIGVMLPNCNAAVITILSILMADKIPAILNFTLFHEQFHASVQKANLKSIITSKQFMKKLNIEISNCVYLEDIANNITFYGLLKSFLFILFLPSSIIMRFLSPESYRDTDNEAVLLFSSGSTGTPKGILLSHHNLNSDVSSFKKLLGLYKKDKICGNLPLFHSFGFNICFWVPIFYGVKTVYIKNPLEIKRIAEAIKKFNITLMVGTPTFIYKYMKRMDAEDIKTIRIVIVGAEKMRDEIAESFFSKYNIAMMEGYGATELAPVVTINLPEDIKDLSKGIGRKESIGKTLPGIAAKIVSLDTKKEQGCYDMGLLWIKGDNVMKGYLNDADATAKAISYDGWYNTSDTAYMDEDGYITITGRLSRFSKIGGEMISHQMVELAINNILNPLEPKIAVAGAYDKKKGEKLIIFYVGDIDIDDLIEKLKESGMSNIAIPKRENFIKIDTLPVLGSGKLDIGKLQRMALRYSS